jgi:hypothetical protein
MAVEGLWGIRRFQAELANSTSSASIFFSLAAKRLDIERQLADLCSIFQACCVHVRLTSSTASEQNTYARILTSAPVLLE